MYFWQAFGSISVNSVTVDSKIMQQSRNIGPVWKRLAQTVDLNRKKIALHVKAITVPNTVQWADESIHPVLQRRESSSLKMSRRALPWRMWDRDCGGVWGGLIRTEPQNTPAPCPREFDRHWLQRWHCAAPHSANAAMSRRQRPSPSSILLQ